MRITLSAEMLEVAYGREPALNIAKLSVEGSVIAVIGHNGAGKSTLIKSILNLLPTRTGSVRVESTEGLLLPNRDMAFCPETGAVFGDISVQHYLQFWCRVKRGNAEYYKCEGASVVERLELAPLLKKLGRELSKGQKRRVQTAIGFLMNPKLFLFDEPFEGLDIQRSQELANLLLAAREKTAVLVTSHRMDVIQRIADNVVLLEKGSIKIAGQVSEVIKSLSPYAYEVRTMKGRALSQLIKENYSSTITQEHPDRLVVIGSDLSEQEAILHLLNTAGEVDSYKPSLADAMELHLAIHTNSSRISV